MDIQKMIELLTGGEDTAPAARRTPKRKSQKKRRTKGKRNRTKMTGPAEPLYDTAGNVIGTRQETFTPLSRKDRRKLRRNSPDTSQEIPMGLRVTPQTIPDPSRMYQGMTRTPQRIQAPDPPFEGPINPSRSQLLLQQLMSGANQPAQAGNQFPAPGGANAEMHRRRRVPQSLSELLGM